MKYACLVYLDEARLDALPRGEIEALLKEVAAYDAALRRQGRSLAGAALKPVETATTVRLDRGRVSLSDGPYAPTREQLGAVVLIEAAHLDEAIAIAARMPALRYGCVEIRAAS